MGDETKKRKLPEPLPGYQPSGRQMVIPIALFLILCFLCTQPWFDRLFAG